MSGESHAESHRFRPLNAASKRCMVNLQMERFRFQSIRESLLAWGRTVQYLRAMDASRG